MILFSGLCSTGTCLSYLSSRLEVPSRSRKRVLHLVLHTIGCISDTRSQKIEHILKFEIIIIIKDSKKANKIVFSCGIYYQSYISAM